MRRREFIGLLGAAAWPLAARAQPPDRIWRIGILHGLPPELSTGFAAFRQRLGQLAYVADDQNIIVDYRWADQMDCLASLAAALAETKVDVIVASDGTQAKAAKQATREIPIVAAVVSLLHLLRSGIGTSQTCRHVRPMSAIEGRVDKWARSPGTCFRS